MKVKLRGLTGLAKQKGLYVTAVKLNDNIYLTGQGIIPGDPSTENNLSLAEMTGKVALSEEKMKRFPSIIDPFKIYHFDDGHEFNLDNPEDKSLVDFIMLCSNDRVADSKSKVDRSKHYFYLENKIQESRNIINKYDNIVSASIALDKLGREEILGVANYIYVTENEMNCHIEKPYDIVVATLKEYAFKQPKKIIAATSESNGVFIKVSTLISRGVLTKRNGEFFEGNTFVASSFNSLVDLYKNDITLATRWDNKLKALQKNVHAVFNEVSINPNKIKADMLEAILDNDISKIRSLTKTIKTSGNAELMSFLVANNERFKAILKTAEESDSTDDSEKTVNEKLLEEYESSSSWMGFYKKFKSVYPDTKLTKKDEVLEFLKKS